VTSDRTTKIFAATVAVALNLAIVGVLPLMPEADVPDEAIQIHWIEHRSMKAVPAVQTPAMRQVAIQRVFPKASAPSKALKVPAAQEATPIIVIEDDNWDVLTSGETERSQVMAPSRLFPHEIKPILKRQASTTFAMQDSSIMAKFDRLGVASLCNNLRILVRGSDLQLRQHGVSREVVVRTMQNEKCRI
jgi:hypothetical protein